MNTTSANPEAPSTEPQPPFASSGPDRVPLRRPFEDRMLVGVAAGLARYFGVDVTIVRIAFAVLTVVGGAGMMVELVIASVALYVWLGAQPGVARSLAHYAIILAGISTVLFNGNPLLRYDGYYMLADLLEIPNLYTRSRTWLGWAAERYLFGVLDAEPPQATPGERLWFVLYGVGSFFYRILVVVAIAFFLLDRVFYIAVGLLILTLSMWVVVPAVKGARYLAHSPRLRRTRTRAVLVTSGVALAVVLLLAIIPMPHRTRAEGVVWVPEEALVRPDTEGFIERLAARPGARVKPGDALVVLDMRPEIFERIRMISADDRECSRGKVGHVTASATESAAVP